MFAATPNDTSVIWGACNDLASNVIELDVAYGSTGKTAVGRLVLWRDGADGPLLATVAMTCGWMLVPSLGDIAFTLTVGIGNPAYPTMRLPTLISTQRTATGALQRYACTTATVDGIVCDVAAYTTSMRVVFKAQTFQASASSCAESAPAVTVASVLKGQIEVAPQGPAPRPVAVQPPPLQGPRAPPLLIYSSGGVQTSAVAAGSAVAGVVCLFGLIVAAILRRRARVRSAFSVLSMPLRPAAEASGLLGADPDLRRMSSNMPPRALSTARGHGASTPAPLTARLEREGGSGAATPSSLTVSLARQSAHGQPLDGGAAAVATHTNSSGGASPRFAPLAAMQAFRDQRALQRRLAVEHFLSRPLNGGDDDDDDDLSAVGFGSFGRGSRGHGGDIEAAHGDPGPHWPEGTPRDGNSSPRAPAFPAIRSVQGTPPPSPPGAHAQAGGFVGSPSRMGLGAWASSALAAVASPRKRVDLQQQRYPPQPQQLEQHPERQEQEQEGQQQGLRPVVSVQLSDLLGNENADIWNAVHSVARLNMMVTPPRLATSPKEVAHVGGAGGGDALAGVHGGADGSPRSIADVGLMLVEEGPAMGHRHDADAG